MGTPYAALDRATIYLTSIMLGTVERHEVRDLEIQTGPYAQYPNALHVRFIPKGKRLRRATAISPDDGLFLVVDGWGGPAMPDIWAPIEPGRTPGILTRTMRHRAFAPEWEQEAREALADVALVVDSAAFFAQLRERGSSS